MAAERTVDLQSADFLSLMRTLAGLTEDAKLRGDQLSAGILSSVAGLLAEVHVAREPVTGGDEYDECASSTLPQLSPVSV